MIMRESLKNLGLNLISIWEENAQLKVIVNNICKVLGRMTGAQ